MVEACEPKRTFFSRNPLAILKRDLSRRRNSHRLSATGEGVA